MLDESVIMKFDSSETFKFCAVSGNYPQSIKNALFARGNWEEFSNADEAVDEVNFLWRPVNFSYNGYDKIEQRTRRTPIPFIFNHFENLKGLTTKTGLIRSLKAYYKENKAAVIAKYGVFDTTPTTFLIANNQDDHEIQLFIQRFKEISN
jgi:hypothetical protein